MSTQVCEGDNVAIAYGMGITAEKVAEQWQVSREDQDAFSLRSHQRALAAIAAGEFRDEISPYTIITRQPELDTDTITQREIVVDTDEGPRADTSAEGPAKLRTVYRAGGPVPAGHPSQLRAEEHTSELQSI